MSGISTLKTYPRQFFTASTTGWDRFWFTPRLPHTTCLLRILTGAMLLYGHIVLASELSNFLGDTAWINNTAAMQMHDGAFVESDMGRSYLWHISNPVLLGAHQALAIFITFAFMVGFLTRFTGPAAWFLQLMFIHRLTGMLFGLDQIVTYSVMYLMLAPCGSAFSVDAWLREKFKPKIESSKKLRWLFPEATPSVAANIATRLLQLHLCVIYLFGGLAKARGDSWWDGTAVWYAIGNYEYQSIDMTWLASFPRIMSALSNATLFWGIFYCALIWPKRTRVIALAVAVAVHSGIALFLGMVTFGLMMLAANLIFVDPNWLLKLLGRESLAPTAAARQDTPEDLAKLRRKLNRRKAKLKEVGTKMKSKSKRLKERYAKVKDREQRYRKRVKRLKEREAQIKAFVKKQQDSKLASKSSVPRVEPGASDVDPSNGNDAGSSIG